MVMLDIPTPPEITAQVVGGGLKLAPTVRELLTTVGPQVLPLPEHGPVHPAKVELPEGASVSVTGVPVA